MILNDRRRPGFPAELVGRLVTIWLGVALLQVAAGLAVGWKMPGAMVPAILTMPTLASMLMLGCAMLLIGRIAYRVFDVEIAGLACLASAMAVPLIVAMRPTTPNNHGLQVL